MSFFALCQTYWLQSYDFRVKSATPKSFWVTLNAMSAIFVNFVTVMKSYVFPGEIEPEILAVAAGEIPYMRTADFSRRVKDIERNLLTLAGCRDGRVIIYTASGTGAMDAVVSCYVAARGKALVIDGGSFGHRWVDICRYYDLPHAVMPVGFAADIDYAMLDTIVEREKPAVLLMQDHETSTGQRFDLHRVSQLCRRHGVSLVVDAISSFLADPFDMDSLGVDIAITSSQKGLNIQPGLAIVFISKNLKDFQWARGSYYFDMTENLRNLTRGQTPYSPATMLFLQLEARLAQINGAGGAEALINRTASHARYFRSLCQKYGWHVPAETPSNAITGFFVNGNTDGLAARVAERGFYIMPCGTPGFFRVNHMGIQSEEDLLRLAEAIHQSSL